MPPGHRRPAKRDDGILQEIFTILPWWAPIVLLVLADGGIAVAGNANQWTDGMTHNFMFTATVIIGLTGVSAWIEKARHRKLLATTRELDHLKALTPTQFEDIVLAAYRKHGYTGSLTGRGADGGVDVILERKGETTYVQCKRWRTAIISVDAVRALKGSMATEGVTRGIFVCCGRFTPEAERYAASSGITTVGGEALLDLIRDVTGPPSGTPSSAALPDATAPEPVMTPAPPCPRCEAPMVRRRGRNGEFWAARDSPAAAAPGNSSRPAGDSSAAESQSPLGTHAKPAPAGGLTPVRLPDGSVVLVVLDHVELAVAAGLDGTGGRVAEADPDLVDDDLVAADLLAGALTLRGGEAALHQPAGDHDTVAGGQARPRARRSGRIRWR